MMMNEQETITVDPMFAWQYGIYRMNTEVLYFTVSVWVIFVVVVLSRSSTLSRKQNLVGARFGWSWTEERERDDDDGSQQMIC